MTKQKKYGPSIRELVRAGKLTLVGALLEGPKASQDTRMKWLRAARQAGHV